MRHWKQEKRQKRKFLNDPKTKDLLDCSEQYAVLSDDEKR
jgi:hypothetical protein